MRMLFLLSSSISLYACSSDIKQALEPSNDIVYDADGDGYLQEEDCDDTDADINPGMNEICDGSDNNCNGEIDEGVLQEYYRDADDDGFGLASLIMEACQTPDGYVSNASDCDDSNADAYPGNIESCDGIDNNCDEQVDEGIGSLYYVDLDGDGFGGSTSFYSCTSDENLATTSDDCDDANNTVFPNAEELCDGKDNNCNEDIDENVGNTYFADADGDGYGDADVTQQACHIPEGFVENDLDCEDSDSLIYPGAVELCDDIDNNCNEDIDEEGSLGVILWYMDADGDGFGDDANTQWNCAPPANHVPQGGDCNDTLSSIAPNIDEICDSIDNNCNGLIDDQDPTITDAQNWFLDHDSDGYGDSTLSINACTMPSHYVANGDDCDDINPSIFPSAEEVCDGLDNSCNGLIDDDDPNVVVSSDFQWFLDNDSDGYGDPLISLQQCAQPTGYVTNNQDCDDTDAAVVPDLVWYLDYDQDGYGQALYSQTSCTQPYGFVANSDDCDDANAAQNPQTTWYLDIDGDGYGANFTLVQCDQPNGYVMNNQDCDDTEEYAWIGAIEVCDGVDNDCDGDTDENVLLNWYLDFDQDGYGTDNSIIVACNPPSPLYVANTGDCDDTNDDFFPTQTEGCDDKDHNCDGNIDNDGDGDGFSASSCGGWDCDDTDASIFPELNGDCAMGVSCLDLLDQGIAPDSGVYSIDPDGYANGIDPFSVYCDMTTDGGGWTQIGYVQSGDSEGYKQLYSSVFSSVESGTMGSGSYKVNGASLIGTASAFRYSEPSAAIANSMTDSWSKDIRCEITTDILNNIQYPGMQNQIPVDIVCYNKTGLSTNAIYMNYQQWGSCWTGPRLWVGNQYSAPNYHGNYCVDCISTWKCGDTTNGVYSGPSNTYSTSTAFWIR